MSRRRLRHPRTSAALSTIAVAIAIACGQSPLPAPPYTSHPTSALEEVPYPPPPARVESVPRRPDDDAVWIDGEWSWQARRYAWKPGRWVKPPAGARFAPWTTVRDARGTLYLARGAWRSASGDEVPEPPPLAVGYPGAAVVVTPEGERVPTGPTLAIDAGAAPATEDVDGSASRGELDASRADGDMARMGDASAEPVSSDASVEDR